MKKATKEKSDYVYSQDNVKQIIGEWAVSWGPVATTSFFSKYASNCMMCSKKKTGDKIFVCIAGTTMSIYTQLVEDINIVCMTKWPYAKGNLNPKISNGLMIGLDSLMNMQGHDGMGSKNTVLEYLKNEVELNPHMEVHVTGISLGGSLATVFGLYLYDNQVYWNPMGTATLNVSTFAAFTCGNDDFRIYYEDRLGNNTDRTWNTLDIVPKMFNQETLSLIPNLYEPFIKNNILIDSVIKLFSCLSGNNGYIQVLVDAPPLIGQYHPIIDKEPKEKGIKSMYGDYTKFLDQGTYQHAQAYFDLLGVGDLWEYFPINITLAKMEDTERILALVTEKMKNLSFVETKTLTYMDKS